MKHLLSFLLISLVALGALAQPAPKRDTSDAQAAPEQRRAALRLALKPTREREAQGSGQRRAMAPLNRQLSTQERSDLRQQLRQQRRDAKLERP